MNSANCAYHRLPLLVLIAAVTTRLERRWALLPRARRRQVILICGHFMCHSEGNAGWETSGGLLEHNIRAWQAVTDTGAICSYRLSIDQGQIKNSIRCRSHSSCSSAFNLNYVDILYTANMNTWGKLPHVTYWPIIHNTRRIFQSDSIFLAKWLS